MSCYVYIYTHMYVYMCVYIYIFLITPFMCNLSFLDSISIPYIFLKIAISDITPGLFSKSSLCVTLLYIFGHQFQDFLWCVPFILSTLKSVLTTLCAFGKIQVQWTGPGQRSQLLELASQLCTWENHYNHIFVFYL